MNRPSTISYAPPSAPGSSAGPILGRVLGFTRFLMGAGALSLTILTAEQVLPYSWKPSVVIGKAHGRIEAADAAAKSDDVTAFTRKNAEAASQPPAFSTMETEASRVQQQIIAESLNAQSTTAVIADFACVIGLMLPRGGDVESIGQAFRGGCNIGDRIRDNMVETLKRGGQGGSTFIQRPTASPAGPIRPPVAQAQRAKP